MAYRRRRRAGSSYTKRRYSAPRRRTTRSRRRAAPRAQRIVIQFAGPAGALMGQQSANTGYKALSVVRRRY